MGFFRRSDLVEAYHRIRRGAVGRACSILILVAPTVDGLCALKILTSLLRSDYVPFKVVPVAGYEDIVSANDTFLQGSLEFRSIVMLDCGGVVDLAEFLSLSFEMTIYLIDSHRPYSLANVFGNSQLLLFDDGFVQDNLQDLQLAYEGTLIDPTELSEDEEEDIDSADDIIENEEPGNFNDPDRLERRRTKDQQRTLKRRHKLVCRQKLHDYYRVGSWSGSSVARLVFDMADGLSKVNNDHLWCAILGTTALFLVERSGDASHEAQMGQLKQHCLRLNIEVSEDSQHPPMLEDSQGGEDGQSAEALADRALINRDGRIRFEMEFRFMLTRHWNLFQSMLHSRYLATRLGVWRERGRRMLETLLVKMGIPLVQSMHEWSGMEPELRTSLAQRLAKHAGDFGLADARTGSAALMYGSFVREFGYVMKMTASDAVYALMALLEAPFGPVEETPHPTATDTSPLWIRNFYYAFDALD